MASIVGPAALLQAQSAYTTTNTHNTSTKAESMTSVENAVNFQKMVAKNFDNFSNMKPEQILAVMKQARVVSGMQIMQNNNHVASVVGALSNSVRNDEDVKRRSIIGDASLSEVIAATSEAKTTLQTTVAARNKLIEMWNQILNMPI